jgi:hypothetical protein
MAGMRVVYRCDVGYGGSPTAYCSTQGTWEFVGANRCVDLGCGPLDQFLSHSDQAWHDKMHVHGTINFTSRENGDVIILQCHPGFVGKPLATCANGQWRLTDSCSPYATSLGCACKTEWTVCRGWMGSNCQKWHGCTVPALGEGDSYAWCELQKASCPTGAGLLGRRPSWDYCAAASDNITWSPQPVADMGPSGQARLLIIGCLCIGISVLALRLYRLAKAQRLRYFFGGTPAMEMHAPETSPSLGDGPPSTDP